MIVGAGLGGLSAALHLAGAGRDVTVFERSGEPGGRCGRWQVDGYSFDTGPTVLTMPEAVERPLAAVGESLAQWLPLRRLDPAYRARFADGSTLDVLADPAAMAEQIRRECGAADAAGFERLVSWLGELYRLELPHFIDRNLDSPTQLLRPPLARLAQMGAFRRLAPKIGAFVRDERLRRLFSFQAMYAGLAPQQALAVYAVIAYLDSVNGVYFPDGGMHALPRALAGAARKHGVRIHYNRMVNRVEVNNSRATAVIVDDERVEADVVVINADRPGAEATLLGRRTRRLTYSPSCAVLHAGSDVTFSDPAHHVIDFGAAWDSTFDEVIVKGATMSDPSFLLTTPTITDPSLAPPGRHGYYALFPVPNLEHSRPIDWTSAGACYQDAILSTLDARGYPGLANAEVLRLTTPADWRDQGLAGGTPFSAAHTFRQTGPFRPATLDALLDNVVFCGSGTQPGVGVPMVLLSGGLAAKRVTG